MGTPQMSDALTPNGWADQPINELLARARAQRCKTQDAMVEALREESGNPSVDRSYISRWETGRRVPTPYWRRHLAAVLEISEEVLDRAAAIARARRAATHSPALLREVEQPGGRLVGAGAGDAAAQRGELPADSSIWVLLWESLSDVQRRAFLTTIIGLGGLGLAAPAEVVWRPLLDRLDGVLRRPGHSPAVLDAAMRQVSRIGTDTVEQLETMTATHRALYHQLSSFELAEVVTGHLQIVLGLLGGQQAPAVRRRLAAIGCETAGHAAWLAHDLGDRATTERCYAIAAVMAREAGDVGLGAYVRGFHSQVLAEQGEVQDALALAQAAHATARHYATATTRAWLAGLEAQARAATQDHRGCVTALGHAERAIGRADPGQDPGWQYRFDQARFQVLAGGCMRRLGQRAAAERLLTAALDELGPSRRRRAEALLELAYVQVGKHDIVAACGYAQQSLDGVLEARSPSGFRQVQRFRARLEAWQDTDAVAALDARLAAAL